MPANARLSDEDVEAIRHYLRLRARQAPDELAALKGVSKAKTP